ncbi:MAG: GCN5-related N-acetyltransferase protein [Rhizobium sp.]|nr:GCN5-related N-acetyltransferase protein [Rhizobium sp.]
MVSVRQAETGADFKTVWSLIADMGEWDARECAARGIPGSDVIQTYYNYTADRLTAAFSAPGTAMFIARLDGAAAGCCGYADAGDGAAELCKMFVQPDFRGRGAARALVSTVLSGMQESRFSEARLVTVNFMTEAISLYRSFGFDPCAPFEDVPESLKDITVYFKRAL